MKDDDGFRTSPLAEAPRFPRPSATKAKRMISEYADETAAFRKEDAKESRKRTKVNGSEVDSPLHCQYSAIRKVTSLQSALQSALSNKTSNIADQVIIDAAGSKATDKMLAFNEMSERLLQNASFEARTLQPAAQAPAEKTAQRPTIRAEDLKAPAAAAPKKMTTAAPTTSQSTDQTVLALSAFNQMCEDALATASDEAKIIQRLANQGMYTESRSMLPRIAVVGEQSHGKSSLFEALTGLDFPRGRGKTTSFPTSLTKLRGPTEALRAQILSINASAHDRDLVSKFEMQWQDTPISCLGSIIDAAGKIILQGNHAFSNWELAVTHTSPMNSCIALSFVDTPGLISSGFSDAEIATVHQVVKDVIKDPRTLVLNLVQSSVDLETSSSHRLISQAGIGTSRTCIVASKLDQDYCLWVEDWLARSSLKSSSKIFLFRGRTSEELAMRTTPQELEEQSRLLFAGNPWKKYSGHCGVAKLAAYILQWLLNNCKNLVTDLHMQHVDAVQDLQAELEALPPQTTSYRTDDRKSQLRQRCRSLLQYLEDNGRMKVQDLMNDILCKPWPQAIRESVRGFRACVIQEALDPAESEYPDLSPCLRKLRTVVITELDKFHDDLKRKLQRFGAQASPSHDIELRQEMEAALTLVDKALWDILEIVLFEYLGNASLAAELMPKEAAPDPVEDQRKRLQDKLARRARCDAIWSEYLGV